jgi:hypothetical protein
LHFGRFWPWRWRCRLLRHSQDFDAIHESADRFLT